MPMRERNAGRSVDRSLTLTPATKMSPSWKGSSAFTHLMSVDLPEPEGPQTTTTSPLSTFAVQLRSTWNCGEYHLLTPLISIAVWPEERSEAIGGAVIASVMGWD